MTLAELRNWVRRRLGAPIVRVELTDEQIDDAFNTAVDKFLYYHRPKEDYYYFNTTPGVNSYGPPDLSRYKKSVKTINDLPLTGNSDGDIRFVELEHKLYQWNQNVSNWEIYDQPQHIPLDVLATAREVVYQPVYDIVGQLVQASSDFFLAYYFQRSAGMFMADLWIAMSAKETFDYTLGLQPTWEILNNKLYIYPVPRRVLKVGIKYAIIPSEEELASHEWVAKATLALSKITLGTIRSKYQGIPGPAGNDITLDGQNLLQSGKEEWEWLLNDIITRSEPLSFSVG